MKKNNEGHDYGYNNDGHKRATENGNINDNEGHSRENQLVATKAH